MSIKDLLGPLVGETSHLVDVFLDVAEKYGQGREGATELFRILPMEVKSALAFFDQLTSRWRYDFGEPLELQGSNQVLLGTHQWPEVEHLYRALRSMEQNVPTPALLQYLKRLAERSKHQEVLFEARPLFYLAEGTAPEFEVSGYGKGNRTIDWRFSPKGSVDILVEVKYRIGDVVQHIGPMAPGLDAGQDSVSSGPGKPEALFPSTFDKFLAVNPSTQLQGAWVYSNIKVKLADLVAYFLSLPEDQLHFAIISTWNETGFLLSRKGVDRERIMQIFGLVEGDEAVVDETAANPGLNRMPDSTA
jgi:hypothetical protein